MIFGMGRGKNATSNTIHVYAGENLISAVGTAIAKRRVIDRYFLPMIPFWTAINFINAVEPPITPSFVTAMTLLARIKLENNNSLHVYHDLLHQQRALTAQKKQSARKISRHPKCSCGSASMHLVNGNLSIPIYFLDNYAYFELTGPIYIIDQRWLPHEFITLYIITTKDAMVAIRVIWVRRDCPAYWPHIAFMAWQSPWHEDRHAILTLVLWRGAGNFVATCQNARPTAVNRWNGIWAKMRRLLFPLWQTADPLRL